MPVRISVITATLDRCTLLRRAIDSVVAQGLMDVEHIIADGGSRDGTIAMLAGYPHLQVSSEPDNGLYHAWNRGLSRATGEIVCILNSDDEIPRGAFASVRAALVSSADAEMVSGPVELTRRTPDGGLETRMIDDARILSLREQDIGPGIPVINGRYFTRRLMVRIGSFDERYRMVSDRDYLLRLQLAAPRHVMVSHPLYRYHAHEGSLTMSGSEATLRLTSESLIAARAGLREATSDEARAAYRRWHAWALFYAGGFELRQGHTAAGLRALIQGSRIDPLWFLRVPLMTVRHVIERPARRGRVVRR